MKRSSKTLVSTVRMQFLRRIRDRKSLALTIILPLILMGFLGMLFNTGNAVSIRVVVVDEDGSLVSRTIANSLGHMGGVDVEKVESIESARDLLRRGMADVIFVLPEGLQESWVELSEDPDSSTTIVFQVHYREADMERNEMLEVAILGIETRVNQLIRETDRGPVMVEQYPIVDTKWAMPHLFIPLGVMLVLVYSSIYVTSATAAYLQESRTAEWLGCTPLRTSTLATGVVLADGTLSTISCTVAVIAGAIFFALPLSPEEIFLSVMVLFAGSFALSMLGFIIGTMSKTQGASQAMSALVGYSMAFFSANHIFPTAFPNLLQGASRYLPLSQTTLALRLVLLNYPTPGDLFEPVVGLVVWCITLSLFLQICTNRKGYI